MDRLKVFLLFLLAAILVAGGFGALHDQISYTVSPEYYTRFKFPQFGLLDQRVPERIRAAQVGFLASWWMGIPLGLLIGAMGFIHRPAARMRRALSWSLALVLAFTLAFALTGLGYGYFQTEHVDFAAYEGWYIPQGLERPRTFLCAGYMHNSAYLGAVLALPLVLLFNLLYRRGTRAV